MKSRLFFFAIIAAIIVAVLGLSGTFGPLKLPGNETETASSQRIVPSSIAAPSVRWTAETKPSNNGKLHLSFRVESSSPVASLQLRIAPVTPAQTGMKIEKELREIPTWLIGNKAIDWDGDIDLTGSLMAGQQVEVQVVAVDDDKRTGASSPIKLDLPEHRFTQPIAQVLYSLRKGLQQDPLGHRNEALRALAVILQQRPSFENQDLTLLTLRSAAVRIALDESAEGVQSALDLLWHAALLFEENPAANVTLSLRITPKPDAPTTKPE
jgi:hypothetical protein